MTNFAMSWNLLNSLHKCTIDFWSPDASGVCVETGCSAWTSGIEICSWPTGWPLWRWPLWWGLVCWEGWPTAVVWGGRQEADQVHWGHHTRQELPLVVSRSSAQSHAQFLVEADFPLQAATCNIVQLIPNLLLHKQRGRMIGNGKKWFYIPHSIKTDVSESVTSKSN